MIAADPLSERVVALCDRAALLEDPGLSDGVARVRGTLQEPLRLALAGRVSSGKSTLLNALLGRRVAPTRETECTQLVTWYRHGPVEKVDVVLRGGGVRTVRLAPDGRLPDDVGASAADVDRLEVRLPVAALERLTLVDTPGLAAAAGTNSARTTALLGGASAPDETGLMEARSTDATGRTDAVLFVFAASLRADERDAIAAFRRMSAALGRPSPVNTLGVLTKADLLTDADEDPWPVAERLAAEFRSSLAHDVSEVVAVCGLLGETVAAGVFGEADADALVQLAAVDDRVLHRLLRTADSFVTRDVGVPGPVRASLLARLSLYGVGTAVTAIHQGARTAAELLAVLAQESRIQQVRAVVETTFAGRADALKASSALSRLDRLVWDRSVSAAARAWLGDEVELLRLAPEMHAIAELHALSELAAGRARLPADLDVEFRRLVGAGTAPAPAGPAELHSLADRFARFAFDAAPSDASVARIAARSIQLRRTEGSRR